MCALKAPGKQQGASAVPPGQATIEERHAFENQVLERLNASRSLRCLLLTAVELIHEAIGSLMLQVFRKDDYAVKYAVEPLLLGNGPLGELSVRLKLLYGLGIIHRGEYEDGERLLALREQLEQAAGDPDFSDETTAAALRALHCIISWPPLPHYATEDRALRLMQRQRYQQVIHSTLVLSLTELISRLHHKQAFSGFTF